MVLHGIVLNAWFYVCMVLDMRGTVPVQGIARAWSHSYPPLLHPICTTDYAKTLASCRALAAALLDGLLDKLECPGEQGAAGASLPYFLVRVCCW